MKKSFTKLEPAESLALVFKFYFPKTGLSSND